MGGAGGVSSFEGALVWLENLLLGEIATAIAVVGVAVIGFRLLRGDLAVRDGGRIILGCFILFGSAGIGRALGEVSGPASETGRIGESLDQRFEATPEAPSSDNPFDPYVGDRRPR